MGDGLVPVGHAFADLVPGLQPDVRQANVPFMDDGGFVPGVRYAPVDPIQPRREDPYAQDIALANEFADEVGGMLAPAAAALPEYAGQLWEAISGIPLSDPLDQPIAWALYMYSAYNAAREMLFEARDWAVADNALELARFQANTFRRAALFAEPKRSPGKCPKLNILILVTPLRVPSL